MNIGFDPGIGLLTFREIADQGKVELDPAFRQAYEEECPAVDTPAIAARGLADQRAKTGCFNQTGKLKRR